MGFDAEVYANKIMRYRTWDNQGTCVDGNVSSSFCELLKPDYFNKRCYGAFKVTREHLVKLLDDLLPTQTTIKEIIEADDNDNNDTINTQIYHARTIRDILQRSDAEIFFVKWDC